VSIAPAPRRPKVVVYTTPWCGYCGRAKDLLRRKGVEFDEVDLSRDHALAESVALRSGRRTVPQVFVDGEPHGGFEELAALDRRGELDAILGLG
jgi:glutaredoxin 3